MKIQSLLLALGLAATPISAQDIPIIDAHMHYSHDAWSIFPPQEAVGLIKEAGLKRAFISSSSDDGTQMLYEVAPEIVVPILRPYRRRGELSTWIYDPDVLVAMKARLDKNTYAGLGEFHAFGDDMQTEVMQGVIQFARDYDLFLHAHSDAEGVDLIFESFPEARVLWAHSGFERPDQVALMLRKHDTLWADLAILSSHARNGKVDEDWRALFNEFPERIMLGTDTYTPERWPFVVEHARWSREWLADLPRDLAENIAWRNAEALLQSGKGWP